MTLVCDVYFAQDLKRKYDRCFKQKQNIGQTFGQYMYKHQEAMVADAVHSKNHNNLEKRILQK